MDNQEITITFENGKTITGEMVSWSKTESVYSGVVLEYNFTIRV